jgi:hypothetical protein
MDYDACSVISCGGKNAIEQLFVIFNELGISTYVVFDYDKGRKPKDVDDAKRIFDRLADTPPSPIATDFIGARLTCLFDSWEASWRADVPDHEKRQTEANAALGFDAEKSSKPLVARFLARQLTAETPPVIPSTVAAVLAKAKAAAYQGSCLKS